MSRKIRNPSRRVSREGFVVVVVDDVDRREKSQE